MQIVEVPCRDLAKACFKPGNNSVSDDLAPAMASQRCPILVLKCIQDLQVLLVRLQLCLSMSFKTKVCALKGKVLLSILLSLFCKIEFELLCFMWNNSFCPVSRALLHMGPLGVRGQVTLAGRYSLLLAIFNMAFHCVTPKQLVWFLPCFP